MPTYLIRIMSDNWHNLEDLFLDSLTERNFDGIECLVTNCPKLKVLHVRSDDSAESARRLLLGLPNLIQFKHSAMVPALEQIIKDGKVERVSALRNLYIDGRVTQNLERVGKSAQVVMQYLGHITELDITQSNYTFSKKSIDLHVSISRLTCLTHLTVKGLSCHTHDAVNILKAVGHQLRLLDFCCELSHELYNISGAIDQCRELRTLRVKLRNNGTGETESSDQNYGNDQAEIVTPFSYLHELSLEGFNQSNYKSALFKSLFASPLLQELTLVDVANLTDHVLQAAFNHTHDEGEQLAFTSLRKLTIVSCDFVTNYLENVVTDGRVPLEYLNIAECWNVTDANQWNLERFQMDILHGYTYNCSEKNISWRLLGNCYGT